MATNSTIEWTDTTWNPVSGCDKVSPGCAHCYAETMAARLKAMALKDISDGKDPGRKRHYIDAIDDKGRWSGKMTPVPESLADPLHWKKPRRVFVNSMSDLFHDDVPDEFIDRVFAVMYQAQWHTFQVLTKRAERMAAYFADKGKRATAIGTAAYHLAAQQSPEKAAILTNGDFVDDVFHGWPIPNVWLGVSAEDQQRADERIPWLLKTPAAVRFVSAEPLLGPIDLKDWPKDEDEHGDPFLVAKLDWVIVGGESGHGARPCSLDWIRSIVGQCSAAGVPCFVKQIGGNAFTPHPGIEWVKYDPVYDDPWETKDKKGGDPAEWPEDLRVRQYPEVVHG
jgi:protein gp37